jgi:hypothetical protein
MSFTKSDQQVDLKIIIDMIIAALGHRKRFSKGLSHEILKFYTVLEIVLRQYRSTIRRESNFTFRLLNLSLHLNGLVASNVDPSRDT